MASAVLANRNESNWGQSLGGFMGKSPYSTPQLNPNPKPNPNPNPNPNSKTKPKKKQFQTVNDLPAVTQAASDDAYSFNQRPIEPDDTHNHGSYPYPYVNFNVSAYSRSELRELRKRLVAELEQIQNLNDRIQSGKLQPRSNAKVKKLPSNKRPMPFGSENGNGNGNVSLMKMCRQILTKLMKPKHSWVFNMPVDAAALGLHDYHQIIKRPMDLGTIKSNFANNSYSSPADFAADVRLTFNNAMMYNPKTDQVHVVASQLLDRFEELYKPILDKLGSGGIGNHRNQFVADELQGSSWNDIPTPERPKKPKPTPMPKKIERVQNQSSSSNPPSKPPALNPPPLVQSPVQTPSPIRAQPVKPASARGVPGKQPKPRAKDPHKREMSMEEKQKLGMGLQNLPQEKMPQLVQIIRKRNDHLAQEGDEIELDIEALDTETLWELDRLVTNWKKFVSKTKRQALMGNNNYNSAAATTTAETDEVGASEIMDVAKRPRRGEAGEEDVDIGEEMPESSFPPVEIEKDDAGNGPGRASANANSSSSSSSSSGSDSSSSDSDSGSSSGSDSGADEAQS